MYFQLLQRVSNYNKIKSYKENREWVKSYLLCLWYLIVHDAVKIKLQEINASWLDFNKSLQLVQVTTQSYFDNWIHTVISLINHYMRTNHRNTVCHTGFLAVVPHHWANSAQYFKGSLCLHHQGTTALQNIRNYSPDDRVLQPTELEHSVALLWEPHISNTI